MLVIGLIIGGAMVFRAWQQAPSTPASSPAKVNYGSGITAVPAVGAVPALTADQAETRAKDIDMPSELMPGTPTVVLRSVTIANGSKAPGAPAKKVDSALAWVLIYNDSVADVHGPPSLTKERREQIIKSSRCSFIVILDANNGETLALNQECVPR